MSYINSDSKKAGSKKSKEPRLLGSIVEEMLHGNSPLAVGYRQYIASLENGEAEEHGWHTDTQLGCDMKTFLRSDKRLLVNKEYPGVLRLDAEADIDDFRCRDAHMTFIESTALSTAERRNVRLYEGRHITCTKRLNGTARLNFKELKQDAYHNVDNYAFEVANEIREALKGFVGE